jgi:NTE family protein
MRTILVLGGGGVKGMTHAGAWKAIQEAGIHVSEIVGTSIGALVAGCIAGGQTYPELEAAAMALRKPDIVLLNRWAVLINGIRQPSVFQREPLLNYIESVLPVKRFQDLQMPVSMNAVDLETGDMHWFSQEERSDVPLAEAIYASCALPVFYPPAPIGDRFYIDGGVIDSLAVRRAAERKADLIIAVDAGSGKARDALGTIESGMVGMHNRVTEISGYYRKREVLDKWQGPRLVYVRPNLDGFSTFDFAQTSFFLGEGYRATREAIESAKLARVRTR